jgi:hypothetical protein
LLEVRIRDDDNLTGASKCLRQKQNADYNPSREWQQVNPRDEFQGVAPACHKQPNVLQADRAYHNRLDLPTKTQREWLSSPFGRLGLRLTWVASGTNNYGG